MSGRVRLRALADGDLGSIFALFSDPVALRYWAHTPYTDRAQAIAYLEENRHPTERHITWAIAESVGDALIGTCSLFGIDRRSDRAEIGYILSPSHWGRGLATEAVTLAIEQAFGALALRRLEADIDPRNTASARLLERLGFQQEGLLRERWRVADEISDTAFYGLLAREWSPPR